MTDLTSGMQAEPYWWEAVPRRDEIPPKIPTHVDVLIVGAGFTGLTTARTLVRAGKSVLVCESGFLGIGASTRNGGMLGPSFHKLGVAGLRSHYGAERTQRILKESIRYVDFLKDLIEEEGIDCNFDRVGRFRCASRPAHFDDMQRAVEEQHAATGIEAEIVTRDRVHEEIGSNRFYGGVRYEIDGLLHPAKYHDGLIRVVRDAGAMVAPNTKVNNIERTTEGFSISTARGVVKAGQVAVCTNGYTSSLTPTLRRRLMPIRSAMIATEPIPKSLMDELMPHRRCYGDSRRIMAYYRPSPDGHRVLFGGRATSADSAVNNARLLKRSMLEVFPQLRNTRITHSWSGLVAYAFDHVPHLGQLDDLYYAMGYCGSGVARASYFGTKLGHKIIGNEDDGQTAFDDLPFESRPLYTGNPWFLPAIIRWHRFIDQMGV